MKYLLFLVLLVGCTKEQINQENQELIKIDSLKENCPCPIIEWTKVDDTTDRLHIGCNIWGEQNIGFAVTYYTFETISDTLYFPISGDEALLLYNSMYDSLTVWNLAYGGSFTHYFR